MFRVRSPARVARGARGVTCVIRKGAWAVKIKWLDRVGDSYDGDTDEKKKTFEVEDHAEMITHLEGCVLVHPVMMREAGSEIPCACAPLPLQQIQRTITRDSHEKKSCTRTLGASQSTTDRRRRVRAIEAWWRSVMLGTAMRTTGPRRGDNSSCYTHE